MTRGITKGGPRTWTFRITGPCPDPGRQAKRWVCDQVDTFDFDDLDSCTMGSSNEYVVVAATEVYDAP